MAVDYPRGCTNPTLRLKPYQEAVGKWFMDHPRQKGLIAMMGLGSGKTLTAINAAEMLLNGGVVNKVIIVTQPSLIDAFHRELSKCRNRSDGREDAYYTTTYQSFHSNLKSRAKRDIFPTPTTFLIIDEAHNLRSIGGKKRIDKKTGRKIETGVLFKSAFRGAEFVKHVLLLTGTPLVNSGTDIIALMALAHGSRGIFNEFSTKSFVKTYYDHTTSTLKSLHTLAPYLKNYLIYYFKTGDDIRFPRKTVTIHHVEMSEVQYELTRAIELKIADMLTTMVEKGILPQFEIEDENEEEGGKEDEDESSFRDKPSIQKLNVYLNRSRQLANTTDFREGKEIPKKIRQIVEMVKGGPKPAVIFSTFVGRGIDVVEHALVEGGIPEKRIRKVYGAMDESDRAHAVRRYNQRGKTDVLLISSAGGEGLNLLRTRQVHIVEPQWNMAKVDQAVGRAIRLDSHADLPPPERVVDVHYWVTKIPAAHHGEIPLSAEERLLELSQAKEVQIGVFKTFFKECSIPYPDEMIAGIPPRIRPASPTVTLPPELFSKPVEVSIALPPAKPPRPVKSPKPTKKKRRRSRSRSISPSGSRSPVRCKGKKPPCPPECIEVKATTMKMKDGTTRVRKAFCRKP